MARRHRTEVREVIGVRGDICIPITVMILAQLLIFQGSSHLACEIPIAGVFDAVCWIIESLLIAMIMTLICRGPQSVSDQNQFTSSHCILWIVSVQQWCMALGSTGCPIMTYVSFGLFGFGIFSSCTICCFNLDSRRSTNASNASTPLLSVHLDSPVLTTRDESVPPAPKSFNISDGSDNSNPVSIVIQT